MTTSYFRGHKIYWSKKDKIWYYCDTKEEASGFLGIVRPCKRCGKIFERGEVDPCLGELPGVTNACCGHGKKGYIAFENGVVIRGKFKVEKL